MAVPRPPLSAGDESVFDRDEVASAVAVTTINQGEALTESEFAHFLRIDRVGARMELDRLRLIADQTGETGFDSIDIEPELVLLPA